MTRRIPVRFSRHASAAVLCLLLGLAYFPISGIRAASTAPSMTLRGAGQPFVSVQSARNLAVSYTGDAAAVAGMQGGARPTALTSVDLDADGAPDLIAGYATANGGVISVTRGNPDAFAPKDPGLYRQAMQGKVPPSFLSKAAAFSVPESPELLASGDFDGDGYRDVLSAARGGSLYLLTGDGHGNLASPRQVSLPGQVSALAVTGSGHLAVAIDSGSVSQLLIVDSKAGFRTLGTYDLPGSATAAAWGSLGDEPSADVAVAAGGKLVIVYDALSNDAQAETISLAFSVQSLTLGDFVWDRDGKTEIAALGNDGAVRILQRGTLDTRPLTAADIPGRRARMFAKGHAARKTPAALGTWTVAKQIDGASSSASGVSVPGMLQPSRLGRTSGRGLMVFDRSQKQVNLVDPSGTGGSAIALASEPVALQVTPPKLNGRRGLIILTANQVAPMSVDETAEAIDPAVDTTADTDPQNACSNTSINAGNISSPISLRSAVCAVNNSGSGSFTITVPPGTYSLSLGELPLGRTSGANISITGTGTPANTIIHQTDGVNRIFEQDPPLTGNIAVSISNVTISGGNASGFGGGAILGGGVGADNLTLTNVVIDSNATATTDAGGGVNFGSSGTFTIIDSTFSNNTATDAPGGALQFSQNANAGSLSITNSIFTNNKATSTAGTLGGALSLLPDTGNTVTITGSTFTGNQALGASGEGGAIYAVGAVTVSNSRIVGNIATSGSGFFESGGAGNTGTAINNWWGCNAGPNNSGCDHVDVDLSSIANFNPWLVLSINASPNQIQTPGTSTLTADLTHNSASTGGFSVPDGTPVTFGGTLGSASPTSTTLTSGQQTSTFTAGGTAGHGTGTATVDNQPVSTPIEILDTVNFDTSPTGLSYTVDSVTYTSPQTFHWVVGSTHPVSTSTPQAGPAGSQYVFANWSDGLGISHNITAPTASTSYTATFNTQYQLTTQASPPGDGTVTPTSGGFYDPGASIAVSATPANAGFIFNNWTSSGGAFDSATSASTNFHMPAAAATVTGNFSAVVTAAGTTTTLTSNNNPSFTTAPNNSVTFTATVTSSAVPVTEGTVTFKEGATTLSGPTALDGSGHASFTTSSLPEGSHLINAVYNGTVNFLTSNGSYTQTVNNHTVVTGNQYCNPGAVTLSNTAASASPYPSQIFVSGAGSSVTNVTLALNHIGSGDVQAMNLLLIDPNGKKFVPFAHAGDPTTISNVDVTLDDAASSGLPNGATLVSGTFKPSSYSGSAISFASPAPAGPYDYAASDGVATLASEFNGTNPNGTWQLYAETSTTGGSGSISGGWCLNIATTATPPDLSIAKTHSGNFTQGQSGTYHIVVTNNGPSPTSGTVTVTDTMPAGLTVSAVVSGAQWSCLGSTTTTVSCTSTSVVAATDSYGAIDVTVHVDANAPATVTNTATVSGSGDVTPANNSSNDPTTINPTPADLTITKTHGGSFTQGQTGATYTITVTNSGHATTSGTVTVTDTLPSGLTATAMSGTGWTCTLGTLTCTNTNPLTATSSYNAITLTVNVAANATSPQVNSATVSGGGETNTANDTATDSTTIGNGPDLTITKTHVGNFTQRQTGAQYTITVTNSGGATTSGTVTVADTLPSGLTATAISGTGWTCTLGTLTCTNTTALAASSSYNAITLTVNVAANATSPQVNSVTVSGGNESNTANDTATDSTNIQAGPDLTITKSHSGNFTQGQTGATYTITVKNIGSTTSGTVNVADALPAGLTATALSGSGWSCTVTPLACSRSTALANNLSYPSITLTVNVASNAPSSVINSATVSGGGESNTANDTASDPTTVNPFVPSFSVSPGSLIFGDVNLGSRKDLTVTVHNTGSSPLNVTGVSLTPGSGPARNDYGYDTECDTVKPGKSCTIEVELHAQDLGSGTATLNIFYNQPGSPAHVSLSGNVINPRARLQPDHLDFGTVQVGHSSVKTATLTSTGDTPLLIVGPDINGSTDFKQTSNCPSSLAPGNSCTITVTFKPSSKTTKSATLRAFDNATGSPQTSALTGKGN